MMDTMADISNLLTEFNARKSSIVNAKEKSALEKDINCLKIAWNSGNAGDAIKHATHFQRLAKKYKAKFSNAFWQTFESIASGDSVPQKMDSSTRPSSKKSRKESETAAASRGSTTQQPVKKESETAAASRGSTTKQPVKNKSQNEKESDQESEKSMVQKLQIIRNHIEDLDAAMRPRPNDVKNSNSKGEECNSLVEIILNQSAEVLNAYRQEKDRISVTENRLKKMFQNATGREYKGPSNNGRKEKKEDQTDTVEVLQQLINDMDRQLVEYKSQHDRIHQDSVKSKEELENLHKRISDTEKMLKDMFQHATGQNYKESSNKDGTRKPDSVEILQQTINDLEKQLTDYTRMPDTEKRLREMFQHVTGREYKGPSISDGKGKKKENQFNTVEVLHQMIADMDKQLADYTSQQDKIHKDSVKPKQELEHLQKWISVTENRLKKMFQNATGREYKGPSNNGRKEKKEDHTDTVEVFQQLINDMDKQLVEYKSEHDRFHQESVKSKEELENLHKRISDTEKRLKDMFQHATGQNYKESSNKDGTRKPDPVEILQQTINDLEKQLVDYTSQQDKVHKDNVKSKQELEHLQKRMTNTGELLREMFQHVTGRDYKGPSISDEKEKTENQFNTMDVLHQMIADMDKKLVDHTRMTDTEKRLREMFQHVTGREYKGPSISDRKGKKKENQYDTLEVLHQMIADMDKQLADYTSLSKQLSNEKQLNEKLSREKDELLIRLSQHVSAKLTNNNPDIADLSDENRPTKLGELYSELYDNEWTDAYEVLNKNMNEKETTSLLLEVLTTSYAYCLRHSQNQEMLLEGLLMLPASTLSRKEGFGTNGFEEMKKLLKNRPTLGDLEQKMLMDLRKATKSISAENVVQIGVDYVKKDLTKDDPSDVFRTYVQKCLHLCWLMCQQSPRMFIEVNLTKYISTKFDKSTFREYLKFGKKVDYVVWLPLYLYEGGSLVKKGVANGK